MHLIRQLAALNSLVLQALGLELVGLLWLCLRCYRTAALFFALGLVWLTLCATPAFANWLQRGLEQQYPQRPAAAYPKADAIVVLGGGAVPLSSDDAVDDEASMQATRTGFGLELFRNGKASIILLSGGEDEALQMAHMLELQGVPSASLQKENVSMNTHQNALYSAAILKREGIERILLVTSAMHMPRALATFRRQGLQVIPAPAADKNTALPPAADAWMPQLSALKLTTRCLREYLGLWIYRLRGWA